MDATTGTEVTDGTVVIIGGGPAGATLARTLLTSDRGVSVVLLTAEPDAPYDRTHLSKSVLTGERDEPPAIFAEDLDDPRLELRTDTEVAAIDPATATVSLRGGGTLRYGRLVLATGAAPRTLPLSGIELPGVHLIRERSAALALRNALAAGGDVIVLGGGLIGLEVAAAARERGCGVTVLEVADRLLGRVLPEALAAHVKAVHRDHGTTIELGVRPVEVTGGTRATGVRLADGRELRADHVVVAVGAAPRTELAADAGIEVEDGILVDDRFRTSVPGIHAVGDAVRFRGTDGDGPGLRTEAWTPAMAMGQHLGRNLLGADEPYTEVPWMWSDQHELTIQAAGGPVTSGVERGDLTAPAGLAVFALSDGRITGVVGVSDRRGIGRTVRGAMPLIAKGTPVTAEELVDPQVDLRKLARERG